VAGNWRRLPNEELNNFYASPKEDGMGGACSTHGTYETLIQCFGRKT
jgi:hypothetical protein